MQRWWDDLHAGSAAVYPSEQVGELESRLLALAAQAYPEREPDLHRLDQAHARTRLFQSPATLGYAAYVDRFAGDLGGLRAQIVSRTCI